MRRLLAAAGLSALLACGLLTASTAAFAADAVRPGWSPMARCEPCGPNPKMQVVHFADERTGWVAGGFGVARTDDGGTTWRRGTGLPTGEVRRAAFNDSRGVAAGEFEGLAVSGDGGLTWKQYRPIPGKVYDVQALPDRLLATNEHSLYTSLDGGITWKATGRFAGGSSFGSRFHFADATHGTVVSSVQVSTTHDGGRTWNDGVLHNNGALLRLGAFTVDATRAYAVGVAGGGPSEYVMARTTDGRTFSAVTPPKGESVYMGLVDVAFTGPTGYAVGWEGALLRSTDAGATWVRETPPPSFERTTFRSVSLLSATRAVAVTFGGGIVTRDVPVATKTTHPSRPLGLGLLGLGVVGLLGAGARSVVARPDGIAAGLVAAGVVVGGAGGYAFTATDEVVPSVAIRALDEPRAGGIALSPVTPSSSEPSAPASASPAPTTSASGPASATLGPTPVTSEPTSTTAPTSAPTTTAPTRPPTSAPTTTKAPGKFTVTPANVAQTCSPNNELGPFSITLKNGTSSDVAWTLEFIEFANDEPWAAAQVTNGAIAAGGSTTVQIFPNGQNVCPLVADNAGDYHLRVRQDTQGTVGGPVLGTVTDRISPAPG